jgi:tetratricopeptide (TPR) repeat protein
MSGFRQFLPVKPCAPTEMTPPRSPRLLMQLTLLSVLVGPAQNLGASSADDKVTVMEPVFVEASSADPWDYFSVPGFEVISHCPDSFNETYARALQLATAARLAVLPANFWGELPTPMKIILYNRRPERKEGFSRGSPIDLNWVSGDGGSVGSGTVVHSYPVTVGDGDTYINCGNYWDVRTDSDDFTVDPDSEIRIGTRVPKLPAWFVAGMEGQYGLYPNCIIRSTAFSTAVVLPSALWISTAETLAIQQEARDKHKDARDRRRRATLSLSLLFSGAVPPDERDLGNSEGALLVRWGLFGSEYRQAFLRFVDAASREPVTEDLFRKSFGFGYDEALARLDAYLPKAVTDPIVVSFTAPAEKPLHVREASSVEIARIVGDWGRLEGRTIGMENLQYQQECMEQAERLFARIYRRGNSDPLFLATFGLYELQVGDDVRAREALEAATRAGVLRPRAYVELARLKLDDALPSVEEGIGDLGTADYEEVTGLLTTARVQMPSLLATYDVLARALEHAPAKPDGEHLRPMEEAMALFPRNAALAYKLANLYERLGMRDEAAAVINRALKFSDSEQDRALLVEFLVKKPR